MSGAPAGFVVEYARYAVQRELDRGATSMNCDWRTGAAQEGPGGIYVESRADLDQVRFPDDLTYLDAVRRYYEEH